jgi:hypothetical protein
MRVKMSAGDVLAVDLPGKNEIQIEAYTDHVTAQVGPQVIFSSTQRDVDDDWERNTPPMLVTERKGPNGPNIARELKPGEANKLIERISHYITNTTWWAERNGWPVQFIDTDGSRVYRKPIEHDTDWSLVLRIYNDGRITVGVEGIRTNV